MVLKNQLGISLVSVLMAMGLVGGLSVFVMNISQQTVNQQIRSTSDFDQNTLIQGIQQLAFNQRRCGSSLGGIRFLKDDIDDQATDGGLDISFRVNADADPLYEAGTRLGNIELVSLKLFLDQEPANAAEPDSSETQLGTVVGVIKKKISAKQFSDRRFSFPLDVYFETDNSGTSTILSCRDETAPNELPLGYVWVERGDFASAISENYARSQDVIIYKISRNPSQQSFTARIALMDGKLMGSFSGAGACYNGTTDWEELPTSLNTPCMNQQRGSTARCGQRNSRCNLVINPLGVFEWSTTHVHDSNPSLFSTPPGDFELLP